MFEHEYFGELEWSLYKKEC